MAATVADLGDTAFGVAYRYEFTRTEHQLRPGEGFDPITRPRDSVRERSHTDQHTFQLARPEPWTHGVDMPCVPSRSLPLVAKLAHWKKWDDTNKGTNGAALCGGCPVLQQCRQSAMDQESGLAAQFRYTVRGGWTPAQRAAMDSVLEVPVVEFCANGHIRTAKNTYTLPKNGARDCLDCQAERRATRGQELVTCGCGTTVKRLSLSSHKARHCKKESAA